MAHYFENDENLKSKEQQILVNICDIPFQFMTDYGVFSKKGLDFGTRSLLETIDVSKIQGKVLDFGCGYGPIGIYIAKTTNSEVHMIDINRRVLGLARKNVSLNHVNVNIYESNIYENVKEKFDFIISNPPIRVGKEILYKILFQAKDYLNTNGELWIVINKDQGAKSVAKDLEKEYFVDIVNKKKGFYIIKCKKK
ncbi:class I SAM-dependent methyltransferase [bacterium]|nr:class I SAM-dependent methyltransferase [bacterium]